MEIKKIGKSIWDKIPKIVRTPIFVLIFAFPIWVIFAVFIKRFFNTFGEGLLIETFGMLLDVLVIGIIILWLNEIRDKKRRRELEIQRYQEEIDDFRGWDDKEATFRIIGIIKRLNKRGVTEIDLRDCYLVDARLISSRLQGADLSNANLEGADLSESNLQGADLRRANFKGAYLNSVNLQKTNLLWANLQATSLFNANLLGAKNIDAEHLSAVKTLYKAKFDPDEVW